MRSRSKAATRDTDEEKETLQKRWYAIHTRSRHEKLVERQLSQKQIENFLPTHTEAHRWKDRYKKVEVPLFAGYVFVQLAWDPLRRMSVLKTPGVVRIVGFGGRDEPVPDEQMEALRRVVESEATVHRHKYLRVGQRVRVVSGALAGVEGILKRIKGADRLVIAVEPIRQAVSVELAGYEVVPVR